jgi:hypothetical protein
MGRFLPPSLQKRLLGNARSPSLPFGAAQAMGIALPMAETTTPVAAPVAPASPPAPAAEDRPGAAPCLRTHPELPTRGRRRYSLGAVRRGESDAKIAGGSSTCRPHRL